jgi:hypothetical protein
LERGGGKKRNVSDLPGATVSRATLDKVYGDHVHQNSGQHLDGGIVDEGGKMGRLMVYPDALKSGWKTLR